MGIERLNAFIRENGFDFSIEENQIDGEFHTVKTATQKIWFKAERVSGRLVAWCGDWRNPDAKINFVDDSQTLDRKALRALNKFNKQVNKEREQKQLQAKAQVEDLFARWSYVSDQSDYLRAKKLSPSPNVKVRLNQDDSQKILVVPMFDSAGELWNVQQLYKSGKKTFHTKARVKGLSHTLHGKQDFILIGEGYATCLAAHLATGFETCVAFQVKNLEEILVQVLRRVEAPRVILLSDWDGDTFLREGVNPGMLEAQRLSLKHNVKVSIPCETIGLNFDFADLYVQDPSKVLDAVSGSHGPEYLRGRCFKGAKLKTSILDKVEVRESLTPGNTDTTSNAAQVEVLGSHTDTSLAHSETDLASVPAGAKLRPVQNYTYIIQPPPQTATNYNNLDASILPDLHRAKNGNIRVLSTLNNFEALMRYIGATLRYNVISKDQEWFIPGESASFDNYKNVLYGRILDICNRIGFPLGQVDHYLTYLCDKSQFNPVAAWIESKPWDGVSRLKDLYATVEVVDESMDLTKKQMKNTFIRKWMLMALAAAYSPDGIAAPGVLVFQGPQYIGKTKWLLSLTPPELQLAAESKIVNPSDKDSVKQTVCYWLVELGELDATFRKSDIAALKGFITRQRDMFRPAYAKQECNFARRTVFFGSVNEDTFLADKTGNRRYWTLDVQRITWDHGLDMQQIWAEVLAQFRAGAEWWLNEKEMSWLNESNERFELIDSIEEKINKFFDWSDQGDGQWLTATEVLETIGHLNPSNSDSQRCAKALKRLNGGKIKRTCGARLAWVPKMRVKPKF